MEAGEATIEAITDEGERFTGITLSLDRRQTAHFNSDDLENGNPAKGLRGNAPSLPGGDWRLVISSDLDIEVLSYMRASGGFLTSMQDGVPRDGRELRVATFNPASNWRQRSLLRLVNLSDAVAAVTVRGVDDRGQSPGGPVQLSIPAHAARTLSAEDLESGGTDLDGAIGDGEGKWRLAIESDRSLAAMSLLESPRHLTNLSTVGSGPEDGVHHIALFPSTDYPRGQGFVRVINHSEAAGEAQITAFDDAGQAREAVSLALGASQAVHFNSSDLENGNSLKGLAGGIGPIGAAGGEWRLEVTSSLDIEVLTYIRSPDGFLTSMLDVGPSAEDRSRLATFNPGSNFNQVSKLRLVNPGAQAVAVTVTGVDDRGVSLTTGVRLRVPAQGARTIGSADLESGVNGLQGTLGNGRGKWQLTMQAEHPVRVVGLMESPTAHVTNLSTSAHAIEDVPLPGQALVHLPDAGLRGAIEDTLGKKPDDPITLREMATTRSLNFGPRGIVDLSGLQLAEGVNRLSLVSNRIDDIAPLAGLTSLTELRLDGNEIDDIAPLAGLTGLTVLGLSSNRIDDIAPLAGLTGLTELSLSTNRIDDIAPLAGLTSLTQLRLNDNEIDDIAPLAALTGLTVLGLFGNSIDDIAPLAGLTGLTALSLSSNWIDDIASLAGLTSLTYLDLNINRIDDIAPLAGLTSLTGLNLSINRIDDIAPLAGLTGLTRLQLSNNEIDDIAPLAGLTGLTYLELSNNEIDDIAPLAGLTRLTKLQLDSNKIDDIAPLAGLTGLTRLQLSNNEIDDIAPLVANVGLGDGDHLSLRLSRPGDGTENEHIKTLRDRGVSVDYSVRPKLLAVHNDNVVVMQVNSEKVAELGVPFPDSDYAQTFYHWFDDAFDFLMFFSNLDSISQNRNAVYSGLYMGVSNQTAGLSRARRYHVAGSYGSSGKLRAVIHFPYNQALLYGPSLHELLHCCANFVVPTVSRAHWGFSSAKGQLGGFAMEDLVELGGGRYAAGSFGLGANGGNSLPYSPWELYLFGYIPPEEVPDLWAAADGEWLREDGERIRTDDGQPIFRSDAPRTYTIDDIIAEYGPRDPPSSEAQWHHRVAVVLLTDEEHSSTDEQLQRLSEHAAIFSHAGPDDSSGYNFWEATGGRGTVTMDGLSAFRKSEPAAPKNLPASFGTPPPPFFTRLDGRCEQGGELHFHGEADDDRIRVMPHAGPFAHPHHFHRDQRGEVPDRPMR